jgi:hypothetical protein
VNGKVSALRTQRRKLPAEDENDALLDNLTGLNNILALAERKTCIGDFPFINFFAGKQKKP